jgi:predicted short-subunit dehydrogenase-like oxidoreductase (DUF2520 family)
MITKVNIIGSGNVATQLAKTLHQKGVFVSGIYSLHIKNAKILSHLVDAEPTDNLKKLDDNVDLNIIAVKDDFITNIQAKLPNKTPIVHTSGSIGMDCFHSKKSYGILYPLQTFTKFNDIDLSTVPFLIEANSNDFETDLISFCHKNLSKTAYKTNSDTRSYIHLAAVISNNFSTILLQQSKKILDQNGIDFNLLNPLLTETLKNAFKLSPEKAQTGPAKRGDVKVINKHLKMIEEMDLKQIYQLLTELIIKEQQTIV